MTVEGNLRADLGWFEIRLFALEPGYWFSLNRLLQTLEKFYTTVEKLFDSNITVSRLFLVFFF